MSDHALIVSLSPHIKGPASTRRIMALVLVALVPAMVWSVVAFGPGTLLVYLVSLMACLGTEFLLDRVFSGPRQPINPARGLGREKRPSSVLDGSAAITAILLAMNLSPSIPLWQAALGGIFAIALGKMVFGGLGSNPFNPALAGRAFMLASFPGTMTVFPVPFAWQGADALSAATPLGALKEGLVSAPAHAATWWDLASGQVGGCIGEVSAIALLAGGIFLIATRVIRWHMPVFFLVGLGALTGLVWLFAPTGHLDPISHILSGGAFLAAFFMVTDMVTSPMNPWGQIVFALGAGILAACIRLFGSYPEGASYAILFMNALVPMIDRVFKAERFSPKAEAARSTKK